MSEAVARDLFRIRARLAVRVSRLLLRAADQLGRGEGEAARVACRRARESLRSHAAFLSREALEAVAEFERLLAGSWPPADEAWTPVMRRIEIEVTRVLGAEGLAPVDEVYGLVAQGAQEAQVRPLIDQEALGKWLLRNGSSRLAALCLRRAVAREPRRASLHNDLGLAFARSQRHEAAIREYERALDLDRRWPEARSPEWMVTWFNLGRAMLRLAEACFGRGDLAGALLAVERAEAAGRAYLDAGPPSQRHPEGTDFLERVARQRSELARARRIVTGGPRVVGVPPAGPAEVSSGEGALAVPPEGPPGRRLDSLTDSQ